MTRETLDEAIDRVARGMTTVPVDAAVATRLRPRLQESSPITVSVMAVCAAAIVLAFAVGVRVFRSDESAVARLPEVGTTQATEEATREPARIAPVDLSPRLPATGDASERSAPPERSAESELVPPAIAALPAPAGLDLAHLHFEPLAVAPMDLSSLEIAGLALTDMGATDDPRK